MSLLHARTTTSPTRSRRVARLAAGLGLAALAPVLISAANTAHAAGAEDLGTAKSFSVLAGSGVTNTGVTKLQGNIGSHETPTITTDTPFVFTGTGSNHAGDGVTKQAKKDLLQSYNAVAGAQPPIAVPQELTRNDPYLPGIYRASSSLLLTGSMTLDGGGSNDGVFIFQAPSSTLTTMSNSVVNFTNGAQPCNVYWQVGSSATFGTNTAFVGNVLAYTSITANTGATFEGRLLANFGAVTLDSNTIKAPGCETGPGGGTDTEGTATDTGTETAGTTPDAGTETDSTEGGTDTAGTTPDSGTDTDSTEGGTDTDSTTGAGAESVAGTSTGADVDSATDSQIGSSTDSGTDTDSATGADSTTDLPDTGGPGLLPLLIGLLAAAGGVVLIASAARRNRSS